MPYAVYIPVRWEPWEKAKPTVDPPQGAFWTYLYII